MTRHNEVPAFGVPVLAYHANNISSNEYTGNDHVALATDLRTLANHGWQSIPLDTLLDWHAGKVSDDAVRRRFVITFDDGSDFDFRDIDHPSCGRQRSFYNVLRDFEEAAGLPAYAASFVIASPEARQVLDERCLIGQGWWNDDWWPEASASGRLAIECHGWDHLHPELDSVAQAEGRAGDFRAVDSLGDCRRQLLDAARYVERRAGRRPRYFAFPWGQYSRYLVERYLPGYQEEHGYRAAFTTQARAVSDRDDRWRFPRMVCGEAWCGSEELLETVEGCQSS
ncbi:MAG: polysaccharide deacetylase family protein [Pseudomonadota bacterium]